jgi:hypothetical protein
MTYSVYVFNEEDDTVFRCDNEWHFYGKYNVSPLPVIPINGSHIADTKVSPLEDGP